MSEMFDKARLAVIRVIQDSDIPVGTHVDSEKIVRAVFEAMREPSRVVLDCRPPFMTVEDAKAMWQTMIDAALQR